MNQDKGIIKEYKKGALTVVWKPKKCIHAAECVKRLPKVYNPKVKPWLKPENASIDELKVQIDACPSGALTYNLQNAKVEESSQKETEIQVLKNGPLLVSGSLNVKKPDGSIEIKTKSTAFCRCGASSNKPYCDGAHNKVNFLG